MQQSKRVNGQTLKEINGEWGVNTSAITKALETGQLVGHRVGRTWVMDTNQEKWSVWLRAHVHSTRLHAAMTLVMQMAQVAVAYQLWQDDPLAGEEVRGQVLDLFFRLVEPLQGQEHVSPEEQAAIRSAYLVETARAVGHADGSDLLLDLLWQYLDIWAEGRVSELLKVHKLLRFAFTVFLEERLQQADTFLVYSADPVGLTLGGRTLQEGKICRIDVAGHWIAGWLAFDTRIGWHLVTNEQSAIGSATILLRPGMAASDHMSGEANARRSKHRTGNRKQEKHP
jgi:hypothetical protein